MPKKKKSSNIQTFQTYVVQIASWEWDFCFGVNNQRNPDDPFMDFRHLEISGELPHPNLMKDKTAKIVVIPDEDLIKSNRMDRKPQVIGSIELHQKELHGYLSIPLDALDSIILHIMRRNGAKRGWNLCNHIIRNYAATLSN